MAGDFNPQTNTREITETSGNTVRAKLYPEVGGNLAIVAIQAKGAAVPLILAKLAEIEALADVYAQKNWTGIEADEGCRPMMSIRLIASENAPLGV